MVDALPKEELALRAHDITVAMERQRAVEFELLPQLGAAVRLAVHLRGAPAGDFDLLKQVGVHVLGLATGEIVPAMRLLERAEFVVLKTEGRTIKGYVPDVPYFENLYEKLGTVATSDQSLTEHEQFALTVQCQLAASPMSRNQAFNLGAERKLVETVLDIGVNGGFLVERRARGKQILLSPSYYAESHDAYADLIADKGQKKVARVLGLIKANQGWPLELILKQAELNGTKLDADDVAILVRLCGDGFLAPPMISTAHAGETHFVFGPRPGAARFPLHERAIYERALALVAAVRQGQLLPNEFRIYSPVRLLQKLREAKKIGANSEALEQYRRVAELRVATLHRMFGDRYELRLIDVPENELAVELAIELVSNSDVGVHPNDDAVLGLREGHAYVESLVGRKRLVDQPVLPMNEQAQLELDTLLLRGGL